MCTRFRLELYLLLLWTKKYNLFPTSHCLLHLLAPTSHALKKLQLFTPNSVKLSATMLDHSIPYMATALRQDALYLTWIRHHTSHKKFSIKHILAVPSPEGNVLGSNHETTLQTWLILIVLVVFSAWGGIRTAKTGILLSRAGWGYLGKGWIVCGATTWTLPFLASRLFYPSWNRLSIAA